MDVSSMKIEVKSTKLLFLYRSFLFKYIMFETKNKELKSIVNALNIKDREQRIEYIYDEGIKYINKYYSDDLCQFENDQCIAQRKSGSKEINGCCRKCPLVTDKGCPSSNLVCKLIYCKTALGNVKLLKFNEIPILKCLSVTQRIVLRGSFFNTREDILKELKCGLIYSVIRMLKKEIELQINKSKKKF